MTRTQVHPQGSLQCFITCLFFASKDILRFSQGEAFTVDSGFPFPDACDAGNICFPKVEQKNGEITMVLGPYVAVKMNVSKNI